VNKTVANALIYNPIATGSALSGRFTASVPVTLPAAGDYVIRVSSPRYLTRRIPQTGSIRMSPNTTVTVPALTANRALIVGDSNGDNIIDVRDYNLLRSCFSDSQPAQASCTAQQKSLTDLNDDSRVNLLDLAFLQREWEVQTGE
jgi:hypothetical protein